MFRLKRQISVNISNNKFHENSYVVYNRTDVGRALSISVVWRLCVKARPKIKDLHFTSNIFCGEREINDISLPWVYRPLFSYICTNSGNVNKLVISYKARLMHTYIIHATLLAFYYYYSDIFQPSKGHPQGVRLVYFQSKINQIGTRSKIQFSEQRVIHYASDTYSCPVIHYKVLCSINWISHLVHFCWSCCGNGSVVLPKDGPLRAGKCRSNTVLI